MIISDRMTNSVCICYCSLFYKITALILTPVSLPISNLLRMMRFKKYVLIKNLKNRIKKGNQV